MKTIRLIAPFTIDPAPSQHFPDTPFFRFFFDAPADFQPASVRLLKTQML